VFRLFVTRRAIDVPGGPLGKYMRWQWHFGLGPELGYAFWALTFFEAVLGAYAPIWPLWIERLGAPISLVGVVLASAGIFRPIVLGFGGPLVDRLDTRKVLIASRVLSLSGLIVAAFAGSWEILFLTVFLNAIGELAFPTIHAYVANHAGDDPVHAFNMTITIGPAAGLIVTPFVSGLVIAMAGMRGAFFLSAILTVCAIGFLSRMDFGTRHASHSTEAVTYRSTLRDANIRSAIILHGCTIGALGIGVALVPNFLEDVHGLSPSLISILSAGAAVGTVAFGIVSSRAPLLKNSPILAATIATSFVSVGLLIFATQSALPLLSFAYFLRGGVFSAWALFLAAMGKVAPPHLRSRGFSIMEIIGGSAMSLGPVIAAQLWRIDPTSPLIVSATLAAVMVAVMLVILRRQSSAEGTLEIATIADDT
jgi:MFS family permease